MEIHVDVGHQFLKFCAVFGSAGKQTFGFNETLKNLRIYFR